MQTHTTINVLFLTMEEPTGSEQIAANLEDGKFKLYMKELLFTLKHPAVDLLTYGHTQRGGVCMCVKHKRPTCNKMEQLQDEYLHKSGSVKQERVLRMRVMKRYSNWYSTELYTRMSGQWWLSG